MPTGPHHAAKPVEHRSTAGRVAAGAVGLVAFAAALFWAAGRVSWWQGWIYLAVLGVSQGAGGLYVWRRDPDLVRRRARPGPGTPGWDYALLGLFGLGYVATAVVGALDSGRYGWSSPPAWTWILGVAAMGVGSALTTWAMAVNTHFEKTVRIQDDRGHRVVDAGPYRIVRHPGYVGAALGFPLAAPALLGSSWALLPAGLSTAALVVRTAMEDRFLRRNLRGYDTYAARIRYRLLPGIW